MSRAFVKEPDGLETFEDLPEKLISEHRNLVTAEGLAAIAGEVARLELDLAEAQSANDRGATGRNVSPALRFCRRRRMPTVSNSARQFRFAAPTAAWPSIASSARTRPILRRAD
jgi:hypothetical protein